MKADVKVVRSIPADVLLGEPVSVFIKRATAAVHTGVSDRAPVDTGNLRASLAMDIKPTIGKVHTNVKYGMALDQPRKRNPRYMRGPFQGEPLAGWFSERGLKDAMPEVNKLFERLAADIKGKWNG